MVYSQIYSLLSVYIKLGPRILHNPLIVGDGEAVTYRVRLKLDGKTVDETELKISFS